MPGRALSVFRSEPGEAVGIEFPALLDADRVQISSGPIQVQAGRIPVGLAEEGGGLPVLVGGKAVVFFQIRRIGKPDRMGWDGGEQEAREEERPGGQDSMAGTSPPPGSGSGGNRWLPPVRSHGIRSGVRLRRRLPKALRLRKSRPESRRSRLPRPRR